MEFTLFYIKTIISVIQIYGFGRNLPILMLSRQGRRLTKAFSLGQVNDRPGNRMQVAD